MTFYRYLYVHESCAGRERKICRKLKSNAGQLNVFVVALAGGQDLLEIYHCAFLQQRIYHRRKGWGKAGNRGVLLNGDPFIVGIAEGHDAAVELAADIVSQVYRETGDLCVKRYFLNKQGQKRAK